MVTREQQLILTKNSIEKLNEFSADIDILKNTYNIFIYCLENEVYMDTKSEIHCFAYVIQMYLQMLKAEYVDILQGENLIL